MRGGGKPGDVPLPANAEELQAKTSAAWKSLLEAAFALTNAVNAGKSRDDVWAAEQVLGRAARGYAAATDAFVEAMRPLAHAARRSRRR